MLPNKAAALVVHAHNRARIAGSRHIVGAYASFAVAGDVFGF
jgi:hypothetical protein